MAESPGSPPHRAAPALARGLAVLQMLARRPGPISATAIARELRLPRSTVYELLGELIAAGFAVHLPERRRFGLGPAAFETGSAYLRSQPLAQLAGPALARLATATGRTAHVAILHGAQTLYLAQSRPATGPVLVSHVGVRLPTTLTATGLSMLAALDADQVRALLPTSEALIVRTGRGVRTLPELRHRLTAIRRRGWAVEDGEISPDTASLAAAVFDHNGLPAAAVGLTTVHRCPSPPAARFGCGADFAEFSTVVRSCAATITSAIGGAAPA